MSHKPEPAESLAPALREAKAFMEESCGYLTYATLAREGLLRQLERRLGEHQRHPELSGVRDPLLGELRAIYARFSDLDAIMRSLLLLPEGDEDAETVSRELAQACAALLGLELEARAVQARIAASAALQSYQGNGRTGARTLSVTVDGRYPGRLRALAQMVRDIRAREYLRGDPVSHEDLLGWLLAIGESNPDLLAKLGAVDVTATLFSRPPEGPTS